MVYLLFGFFSVIAIIAAIRVVSSKDYIHAILWLVLTFFSTAALFIILGAEFLAAMQVLVYTGAIVILYAFAMMLINIKEAKVIRQFHKQKGWAIGIGLLIFAALGFVVAPQAKRLAGAGETAAREAISWGYNSRAIGTALYTKYIFPFEVVSLILLVAIIGAVVLALRKEP